MTNEDKPLRMSLKIAGGKNSVIPAGVTENLRIDIMDEFATFHFDDCKTTKKFAEGQSKDGVKSAYSERLKKTFCEYPSMNKQAIFEDISRRLKELSKK